MDMLRSVLGGQTESNSTSSSAETIEKLVDRLSHSTLFEDRRDACRALKAMSKKYRVEVGVQALDHLTQILCEDRNDDEILSYALDTLCNVVNPEEFEDELGTQGPTFETSLGENFTEIYLKKETSVHYVLDLLVEYEFKVRRPCIKLLTSLLTNKPRETQELILSSHMGVSRLMDVLSDQREILRNDMLLLLIKLTQGNANLQKIVAFENGFDRLIDIISTEGFGDGGIVVEDCLRLFLNLLRNNSSNQTFFLEGSYIQKIVPFFTSISNSDHAEFGWSAQKVSNALHMLFVVRTLVSPSNSASVITHCQNTIETCGLLKELCKILMTSGIPADVLTETINTISEVIRGNSKNQTLYAEVQAPSTPPKPVIILLLMSMVNEKQPFSLRCAVLYCVQSFLHNNPTGQCNMLHSSHTEMNDCLNSEVSSSQLLYGGLFSNDKLSNWFSACAIAHALMDQDKMKKELLSVQLSMNVGCNNENNIKEPIPLLNQCCTMLQHTSHIHSKIGLLILITSWLANCPRAVVHFLKITSTIPYLMGQICSNDHDEIMRLSQGLCAFLLGICIITLNHETDELNKQQELLQVLNKRIGLEVFTNKLGEISKHEAYNKALKHPQLKCLDSKDLIFDYKWCTLFKHLEHDIMVFLRNFSSPNKDSDSDHKVLMQYKEVIRDQDLKIQEISHANIFLQNELNQAKQKLEELSQLSQSFQDQNLILKQQNSMQSSSTSGSCRCSKKERSLIKNQEDVDISLENEISNLKRLLDQERKLKKEIQEEQEDLLVMLADQDSRISKYKLLLKDAGITYEDLSETEDD